MLANKNVGLQPNRLYKSIQFGSISDIPSLTYLIFSFEIAIFFYRKMMSHRNYNFFD